MSWNFRRRVKVAPGVYVNLGKNGVSTSIGPRGAKITMGRHGTYINTGIPGTGIYSRKKIGEWSTNHNRQANPITSSYSHGCGTFAMIFIIYSVIAILAIVALGIFNMLDTFFNMFSDEMSFVLSFAGVIIGASVLTYYIITPIAKFRAIRNATFSYKREKRNTQKVIDTLPIKSKERHILKAYLLSLNIAEQIDQQNQILEQLKKATAEKETSVIPDVEKKLGELDDELRKVQYNADEGLTEEQKQCFEQFCNDFETLSTSDKIWYVTGSNSTGVLREETTFELGVFDYIYSEFDIPVINIPKSTVKFYFYPQFILRVESTTKFSVYSWNKVELQATTQYFVEKDNIYGMGDADLIKRSFLYENMDGSPDRRRSYNPMTITFDYAKYVFPLFSSMTFYISNKEKAGKASEAYKRYKLYFSESKSESDKPLIEAQKRQEEQQKETERIAETNYFDEKISEQYFNELTSIVQQIHAFVLRQYTNENLRDALNHAQIELEFGGTSIDLPIQKLQMVAWMDMILGHIKMKHKLDVSLTQEIGLLQYFALYSNGKPLQFKTIQLTNPNDLYHSCNKIIEDIAKGLGHSIEIPPFIVSRLLSNSDETIQKQYKVLLYRYFSLASKVDNRVSREEDSFLKSIIVEDAENSHEKKKSGTPNLHDSSAEQLSSLIGLVSVKKEIQTLTNFVKIQQKRAEQGLKSSSVSYHCVFTGNPGTGKTTVARIVADIYKNLGVLKKGHLVETDRAGLVAEYVGQTAIKTNKIIDSALDGVLFIDEAYSLVGGGESDYGKEAIATLLKRMEDDRERLVVILAGYTKDMKQFIDSNPGLQSRFNRYIEFPDYTSDELYQIFALSLKKYDYHITDDAKVALQHFFEDAVAHKDANFGNGRFVRNIFEKVLEHQANRLASESNLTTERLSEITIEDLP